MHNHNFSVHLDITKAFGKNAFATAAPPRQNLNTSFAGNKENKKVEGWMNVNYYFIDCMKV